MLRGKRGPKLAYDCLRCGSLGKYIWHSARIPGWKRGDEAVELARASRALPPHAIIVEIGSFMGSSAVLLAGARKSCGSGKVHCIDPFDASGDAHSVPIYKELRDKVGRPLREVFEDNLRRAAVRDWVEVHQGYAPEIGRSWGMPIDMLFMDGDQSYQEVMKTYDIWSPHLKIGGILVVGNSTSTIPSHDGSRRLVLERISPPEYSVRQVVNTTFAVKRS
jgi:MMP 1-O-methyltransferase